MFPCRDFHRPGVEILLLLALYNRLADEFTIQQQIVLFVPADARLADPQDICAALRHIQCNRYSVRGVISAYLDRIPGPGTRSP